MRSRKVGVSGQKLLRRRTSVRDSSLHILLVRKLKDLQQSVCPLPQALQPARRPAHSISDPSKVPLRKTYSPARTLYVPQKGRPCQITLTNQSIKTCELSAFSEISYNYTKYSLSENI